MTSKQPRHAATVILVRSRLDGEFELFMTRRPSGMNFLGGAYVFPGGTVRKKDSSETILERCRGLSKKEARRILGASLTPELALGHWVAGIRELFEEVGVLLCVTGLGELLNTDESASRDRLNRKRAALLAGSLDFAELLKSEGLFCDAGRLLYFSHWMTPEEFPTRFDTRFYLAPLPAGQSPLPTSEEVTHSLWITPENALALCQRGELPVIFPTYASLRTLAEFDSLQILLAEYGNFPAE
jgi:8-oxo-dGTP pyrophosphatase MutT (NUDIX family)